MNKDEIIREEAKRLERLPQRVVATWITEMSPNGGIHSGFPVEIESDRACSEQEMLTQVGLDYVRIPVTDHCPPRLSAVEELVKLVWRLVTPGAEPWLHFHCHAGDGRTTSFLAMYDIIRNAPSTRLSDILTRQALIGPEDLTKIPDESWKAKCARQRQAFLECFYAYVGGGAFTARIDYTTWLVGNPACRYSMENDCTHKCKPDGAE